MNDEDEKFFNNLPVGYRFSPTDQELVGYYLKNKFLDRHIPLCRVRDENLYDYHPEDLAEKYELNKNIERCWYFFTGRGKKYPKGRRPDRTTARDGFWKATGKKETIFINGEATAFKSGLDYYNRHPSKENVKTDWKMHEFVLCTAPALNSKTQLDKCVVCKIYNKNYNAEARNNNEDDTSTARDPNTSQTTNTDNDVDVDVEATTADDSNANQAANTYNEDVAAETSAGDLNSIINQTTDIINFHDEYISNQAQLVHNPTDHQPQPQPQSAPDNNNNFNYYCYPGPGINQDLYDICCQSCTPVGADEQKPYDDDDHLYPMHSNFSQYSLLDQTRYNMMMMGTSSSSSSNQVIPYSGELFSNADLMNGGASDVQPLSSVPYHSPKRTRFGF